KAEVGSKVQLSISDIDGSIVRVLLRIKGIYKTGGASVDRGYALMNISRLQELLKMPGEVSQIAIFTDLHSSKGLAKELRRRLRGQQTEVLHWQQALPTLHQLLLVDTASMYIFLFIIFFIVAAGILNSVLMSVLERTREFGVLKALGMRPGKILQLIMSEAFLMGLFAIIVGLAVGLTMSYIVSIYGLDPADLAGGEQGMEAAGVPLTEKLYPKITAFSCVWSSLFVMILTLISALPPSLRAAKILPVKAIRE
ncbi:FtsX-like permease family protein, partial [Myxococcota bacterium]|nr:FtsX-like permease family protein [Myxococcota bacterium]